jgi:hypothetical protein
MTGRSGIESLLGSVTLEKLDGSFVLFGSLSCFEGSEVPPLARPGILLSRVEPILTRLQLSNHCVPPMRLRVRSAGAGMENLKAKAQTSAD